MALAYRQEVTCWLLQVGLKLVLASAVMVTALVAESPPQTLTPVPEAFVMVSVGFGVDWVAMWGGRPAWLLSFLVVDGHASSRDQPQTIRDVAGYRCMVHASRDIGHTVSRVLR